MIVYVRLYKVLFRYMYLYNLIVLGYFECLHITTVLSLSSIPKGCLEEIALHHARETIHVIVSFLFLTDFFLWGVQ
jgi:hypothetical protein